MPFKRNEQLKEHLRRVHRDVGATITNNYEANESSALVPDITSPRPYSSQSLEPKERSELPPLSTVRRKRRVAPERPTGNTRVAVSTSHAGEDLQAQVKRLKQLVERKDKELETTTAERDMLRKSAIEKDAQIRLLRDMVQDPQGGPPLSS